MPGTYVQKPVNRSIVTLADCLPVRKCPVSRPSTGTAACTDCRSRASCDPTLDRYMGRSTSDVAPSTGTWKSWDWDTFDTFPSRPAAAVFGRAEWAESFRLVALAS